MTKFFFIFFISIILYAGENPKPLTIEQSLYPVWGLGGYVVYGKTLDSESFPYLLLNKKVKGHLIKIIKDMDVESKIDLKKTRAAFELLGFIGDEKDLSFIKKYLHKDFFEKYNGADLDNGFYFKEKGSRNGFFYISTGIASCLGSMIVRNIKGAKALALKYCKLRNWYLLTKDESKLEGICGNFIKVAYIYCRDPALVPFMKQKFKNGQQIVNPKFQEFLIKNKTKLYLQLTKAKPIPKDKFEFYDYKWGKEIRSYLKLKNISKKVNTVTLIPTPLKEGDKKNIQNGTDLAKIANEAQTLFVEIFKNMSKGEWFEDDRWGYMYNGKLMSSAYMKLKNRRGYDRDFEPYNKIFSFLNQQKQIKLYDFEIKVDDKNSLKLDETGIFNKDAKLKSSYWVLFKMSNTEKFLEFEPIFKSYNSKMYNKLFPANELKGDLKTLNVIMLKTYDGKWYFIPWGLARFSIF